MLVMVTASVFVVALWLYVTSLDGDITKTLVSQAEFVSPQPRVYTIQCSEDYSNYKRYPGEFIYFLICFEEEQQKPSGTTQIPLPLSYAPCARFHSNL